MIISDGYTIEYFKSGNRIEIQLPQTWSTISNTVSMISNRKLDITDSELSIILAVVKTIMERE